MPDEQFSIATIVRPIFDLKLVNPSVKEYEFTPKNDGRDADLNIPNKKSYNQPPNLVTILNRHQQGTQFSVDGQNPTVINYKKGIHEGHIVVSYNPLKDWDFTVPPPPPPKS